MRTIVSIDSPASPDENMRRDAAMLEQYLVDRVPRVRIYTWNAPCFTYGRNQNLFEVFDEAALRRDAVSAAQRPTGGQVLCHGHDVSYAVVASCADASCGAHVKESYRRICGCVVDAYRRIGIEAALACDRGLLQQSDRVFCLAGREAYDIVLDGKKIGGNAQRRVRDVFLQHGSLPLSYDHDFVARYVRGLGEDLRDRIATVGDRRPQVSAAELSAALCAAFETL